MDTLPIRLGTRASALAMAQSTWVRQQLVEQGHSVELIQLTTEGDVHTGPLAQIGGQGVFTKRLQQALLDGEIDLAVHSLKDLPTVDLDELVVAAVPEREDPADVLIGHGFDSLAAMPKNAIVGTGSVRRAAQIRHLRPDVSIRDIRGNVGTRLNKLETEDFDAIILALAGLKRLGLEHRSTHCFGPEELLPAVGQGALGLEVRRDDEATRLAVEAINDPASHARAMAERWLLKTLFAGCLAPVGASTVIDGDGLTLTGVVLSHDGSEKLSAQLEKPVGEFQELGSEVARQLLDQGAGRWLGE